MATYRTFRNTDPPHLVTLWNEAFTGRGAVQLENSTPLEHFVFAKPTFDPAGLIVAEQDDKVVGYVHAALSPAPAEPHPVGVICVLGVHHSFRRHGIAAELLTRAEDYLRQRGAKALQAGPCWPHNPFYLGLYGGADSPGFLKSEPQAEPFFLKHNYQISKNVMVLQKDLEPNIKVVDLRFSNLRGKIDIVGAMPRGLPGYWQECILGFIEPAEFRAEERDTGRVLGRTLVWEMEGFARRWGGSAIGILRFEVEPDVRRLGVGKFLLTTLLRQVREQFFHIAEVHLDATNTNSIPFLHAMGFRQVDAGQVFTRPA